MTLIAAANSVWEATEKKIKENFKEFESQTAGMTGEEKSVAALMHDLGISKELAESMVTSSGRSGNEGAYDYYGQDWRLSYQQGSASNYYNPNMAYVPADAWTNKNQLTSDDISGFRGLPAQMMQAVANGAASGAAAGVSGIMVTLDGEKVGMLVAPYVSQTIAKDIP